MYRAETNGRSIPEAGDAGPATLWRLCVAIGEARRAGRLVPGAEDLVLRVTGDEAVDAAAGAPAGTGLDATVSVRWSAREGWALPATGEAQAPDLFELYRPLLCLPSCTPFVLAHLGQSIDGQIATRTGDSHYVNCPADIVHLHRLRALCDAVVVGRETAALDDPMLTTRLVPGPNPVRVVVDPDLRLPASLQVLTDGRADTLVACAGEHLEQARRRFGASRVIAVPRLGAQLDLAALRAALVARGLCVLFVEGGGLTVSRFVEQGVADRLHLAVAPVLVGAGRRGLQLAGTTLMRDSLRPAFRLFRLGADVLWDFDLRAAGSRQARGDGPADGGVRVIG